MSIVKLAVDMPVKSNRGKNVITFVVIGTDIETEFASYCNRAHHVVINV